MSGPSVAQMGKEERRQARLEPDLKGQGVQLTGRENIQKGEGLESFLGKGMPSPIRLLWPRWPQLSVTSGRGLKQIASSRGGATSGLSQARPSGPHRPEPKTLAPDTQSSQLES